VTPPVLLAAAAALLALLVVAGFGLAFAGRAPRRRRARFAQVTAPHRRAQVTEAAAARPGEITLGRLRTLFFTLIGHLPERSHYYPISWWLVLVLAAPLARVGVGLLSAVAGDAVFFALPLVWLFIVRAVFTGFERRRLGALYLQLPDALAMIVRAARVGIPVTEAIRTVAREAPQPTATEFGELADRLAIGLPLPDALTATARQSGLPEYGFFATALILQNQTGGGLSETLENLAEVIRRRVGLRARAHALASEARTSAMILILLPVIAASALLVISPDYIRVLYADPGGQQIAAAAIGMVTTGGFVMRSIIRRSLG
jgi:tight adherence protein B